MKKVILLAAVALGVTARAESGVTDTQIVLGERSAFSGPSAGLGVELWRGESAAFAAVNEAGGVNGRKVELVLADDAYDTEKAIPGTLQLVEKGRIFALFGGVGTPTLLRTLPMLLELHTSEHLFQFSCFTGAQPQREPPNDRAVFNVRASYRQETRAMVDAFVAMGRKHIGVLLQDDAYGTSGRDGTKLALAVRGLQIAAEVTYPRGQKYATSTVTQVEALKAAHADAIIVVGSYQASAALIRDARLSGWNVPIHNLSFVGADQMLSLLREEEHKMGKSLTGNLLVTQVVPPYDDLSYPLVRDYRAAIQKYQPTLPPDIGDGSYKPSGFSFGSLEGYLNAKAFLAVLAKVGKNVTRQSVYAAAEGMGKFDVGLKVSAELSATRHQALDKVWFTAPTAKGWVAVGDPRSVIH